MRIIGLTGRAGAGKDTAYGYIEEWAEEHGLVARREAFADRLKVSAAKALGFAGEATECIKFCNQIKRDGVEVWVVRPSGSEPIIGEPIHVSGREFLQLYGTEAHRDVFGKDFWVDAVLDREYRGVDILVITDVRFPNEAEAILDAPQRLRPKQPREVWEIVRPGTDTGDGHASEQPLPVDLLSRRIRNDGDLDDLRTEIRVALRA